MSSELRTVSPLPHAQRAIIFFFRESGAVSQRLHDIFGDWKHPDYYFSLVHSNIVYNLVVSLLLSWKVLSVLTFVGFVLVFFFFFCYWEWYQATIWEHCVEIKMLLASIARKRMTLKAPCSWVTVLNYLTTIAGMSSVVSAELEI